jgi:hypothetical protein
LLNKVEPDLIGPGGIQVQESSSSRRVRDIRKSKGSKKKIEGKLGGWKDDQIPKGED